MHEVIDDTDEDEPETNTLDEATPLLPKSVKARLSKSIQEFMAMLVLWHLLCIARGLFFLDYAGNCTSRGNLLNCKAF